MTTFTFRHIETGEIVTVVGRRAADALADARRSVIEARLPDGERINAMKPSYDASGKWLLVSFGDRGTENADGKTIVRLGYTTYQPACPKGDYVTGYGARNNSEPFKGLRGFGERI